MKNRTSPLGLTLIVLGLVLVLKFIGEINASYENIRVNMLLFFGIVSVFFSFGSNKKGMLFIGVVAFMTGVLLYILNNFDIMSTNRIIIFSLFLILAIGFLFLFLNDFSEKVFLVVSIVLILPGYTSLLFYDSFEWIRFSASICRTILNLWQFLLIIIGVGVLTDRRT